MAAARLGCGGPFSAFEIFQEYERLAQAGPAACVLEQIVWASCSVFFGTCYSAFPLYRSIFLAFYAAAA